MKKLLIAVCLVAVCFSAVAQRQQRRDMMPKNSAGPSFSVASISYDGTNDNVTFSGSAVTFPEGKNLTIVMAVWPFVTNSVQFLIQGRTGSTLASYRVALTVSGGIQFFATDTNNIQCALANTAVGLISTGQWNTVYVTVDTANSSNCKIYVNGADTSVSWTLVNTNMGLNRTHLYMGTDDSNGNDFKGYQAHAWMEDQTMAPATYHSAFFNGIAPVDVGSDGSLPGVTPGFYMKYVAGSLGVNSGSLGGTGTLNGPPISGPTFP